MCLGLPREGLSVKGEPALGLQVGEPGREWEFHRWTQRQWACCSTWTQLVSGQVLALGPVAEPEVLEVSRGSI